MTAAVKKENKELSMDGIYQLLESIVERQDDIRTVEVKRLDEQINNMKRQAEAESERRDALRKADIDNIFNANERAVKQAEILAKQVADNADVLRKAVAETATVIATQLQQITNSLIERLAAVEKIQNENKGRSGVSAPLLMLIAGFVGGLVVFIVCLLYTSDAADE